MINYLKDVSKSTPIGMLPDIINYNNKSIKSEVNNIYDSSLNRLTKSVYAPTGSVKAHFGEFVNLSAEYITIKNIDSLKNTIQTCVDNIISMDASDHAVLAGRFTNDDIKDKAQEYSSEYQQLISHDAATVFIQRKNGETVDDAISDIDSTIQDLSIRTLDYNTDTNTRIDDVNTSINYLDNKSDQILEQLISTNLKLADTSKNINNQIKNTSLLLDNVSTRVNGIANYITGDIDKSINNIDSSISNIQEKIAAIDIDSLKNLYQSGQNVSITSNDIYRIINTLGYYYDDNNNFIVDSVNDKKYLPHTYSANTIGAFATGYCTQAGDYSVAEGYNTTASGYSSHAEGYNTTASGYSSHAEGYNTTASGDYSHADGYLTTASGDYSHAEGYNTTASKNYSHSLGQFTTASGDYSHAEGYSTTANGTYSHAEGCSTTASGINSHAEGYNTSVGEDSIGSHTEGCSTFANRYYSHAEGIHNIANSDAAHAEGEQTQALGYGSHSEGQHTEANGSFSHAEGQSTITYENCSHTEGYKTIANEKYSHAEGYDTLTNAQASHTEGYQTITNGGYSHSEGQKTVANGINSHAEGLFSQANGISSHAEGYDTSSNGDYSHAEGKYTIAKGKYSHAEGFATTPNGIYSHAEGKYVNTFGEGSHAEGYANKDDGTTNYFMNLIYNSSNNYFSIDYQNQLHNSINVYDMKLDVSLCWPDNTEESYYLGSGGTYIDKTHTYIRIIKGVQSISTASNKAYIKYIDRDSEEEEPLDLNITYDSIQDYIFELKTHNEYINNDNIYIDIILVIDTDDYTVNCIVNYIYYKPLSSDRIYKISTDSRENDFYVSINANSHNISFKDISIMNFVNIATKNELPKYLACNIKNISQEYITQGKYYIANSYSKSGALGKYSHAEGYNTLAENMYSHAEGGFTQTSGKCSHAEGFLTTASGEYSHAEGLFTTASGYYSHAEGYNTIANCDNMLACGQNNKANEYENILFQVGNGVDSSSNSNAFTVCKNDIYIDTSLYCNQTLNVNETATFVKGAYETSDIRLKNVHSELDLNTAYAMLDKCSTILYDLNNDPSHTEQIGMIAQEVEEFFPQIVNTNEVGFKSINYAKVTVILFRIIKDLADKVNKK